MVDGECNSRIFHRCARNNIRGNHISMLKNETGWAAFVEEVKSVVWAHFAKKFTKEESLRPALERVEFNCLSIEDNDVLVAPFTMEEVRETIWSCDGSKSLGADGFSFEFLKSFWELLQDEIKGYMKEFNENDVLPKSNHPQSLNEYRSISLVVSLYKIVVKVLLGRIKKVIGKIIPP